LMAPQRGAIFFVRARIKWRRPDICPGLSGQGQGIAHLTG